jgi:hypothetical protein
MRKTSRFTKTCTLRLELHFCSASRANCKSGLGCGLINAHLGRDPSGASARGSRETSLGLTFPFDFDGG